MEGSWVKAYIQELPEQPGVYEFKHDDTILYIGKAVNIRDRVRSYVFPRSSHIRKMVGVADKIDFTVTDTETQALLLEANLIKKYKPKFNIRLTDDKSYPYIELTDHKFPKIEITRDPSDTGDIFGPFTNKKKLEKVVKALRDIYGVRRCSDHKFNNRIRPCIDYEIGICSAPCTREITQKKYIKNMEYIKDFLEGSTEVLSKKLYSEREEASENRNYERASNIHNRLKAVKTFHNSKSDTITKEGSQRSIEVLAAVIEDRSAVIARLRSEKGKLLDKKTYSLNLPIGERSQKEILGAFISQFYADNVLPDLFVIPEKPPNKVVKWINKEGSGISIPNSGRRSKLIDLAYKNAKHNTDIKKGSKYLARVLGIEDIKRIEGFDISHTAGTNVVGSNVVFVDEKPEKQDYRRKKLDDVNDDYLGIYKIIKWRARRSLENRDGRPDPDLLLIDGGKSQLNAANKAIEDMGWNIPLLSLAKKEETVYTYKKKYTWSSSTSHLRLLQKIRDEAHRFAVNYHKKLRRNIETDLDKVSGIGTQLRNRLFRKFGSIDNIKNTEISNLKEVKGIGERKAKKLKENL